MGRSNAIEISARWRWIAALLLSLHAISPAQQVAIGAHPVPAPPLAPRGITAGPDGALWFTERGASNIGRITTAGAVQQYPVLTAGSVTSGITTGPDGALWFTEVAAIGRITMAGAVSEFPGGGDAITAGPDGALWFTSNDAVGRITTTGSVTYYPLTLNSGPYAITQGPDGALWFTEKLSRGNKIARISTAGVLTEYPLPHHDSVPTGITAGPDGALWFTERSAIGRISTDGAITEYSLLAYGMPNAITVGPDGALWFTDAEGSLGRITTGGAITQYALPDAFSGPYAIVTGPDGSLWFTEGTGAVGQAVFVTASLTVTPPTGSYRGNLTFSGTGFAPNESVMIYVNGAGSAVLASANADASGSFAVAARAPQSPYGPRLFLGAGQSSGKLGAASYSSAPRLILNPNSGSAGSQVTVNGYGFGAFEKVQFFWNDTSTVLGSATANIYGSVNGYTFQVPASATPGVSKVFGVGHVTRATCKSTLTVQ